MSIAQITETLRAILAALAVIASALGLNLDGGEPQAPKPVVTATTTTTTTVPAPETDDERFARHADACDKRIGFTSDFTVGDGSSHSHCMIAFGWEPVPQCLHYGDVMKVGGYEHPSGFWKGWTHHPTQYCDVYVICSKGERVILQIRWTDWGGLQWHRASDPRNVITVACP